nr:alpha-mannosidase [Cohnella sp. GbtcB17]
MFLNGKPYQGVDTYHDEVFLPAELAGQPISMRLRLWSGLGGYQPAAVLEHQLRRAEVVWLDEAADDLYYTGKAMLDTAKLLQESQSERHELLAAVDRAFGLLDWSHLGSASFYDSVQEAVRVLRSELAKQPKQHRVEIQCIGHTHIDVAWLWRLTHTREKVARSFSTVLRLMEKYPDYVFLQTMPQLYAYIKSDYPEIYEQIKERVKEGRWEAGGAMWLEADCNLTSGESLVRQLLHGTRFFREEFGVECKYLWLPDVFGYSWALPQILRKAGIEAFMTTKISWNQYNRMPHDTFVWRGIDGTDILTHFITTPEPGHKEGAFFYTYNGGITPFSINGIWEAYRDKALNRKLLLAYGYGDGGGGVNREMLEMRRRLAEMPGLPKVTTGRADTFFEELKERVEDTDQYVHTWDGELYLELHRGTYTSQAYNKRMNRKLELALRETEWMNVLSAVRNGVWDSYPGQSLYEAWQIVLRNQFHDIIPGSSIREVYEDSRAEYSKAKRLVDSAWAGAAQVFTTGNAEAAGGIGENESMETTGAATLEDKADGSESRLVVFNSASWKRSEPIRVVSGTKTNESGVWRNEAGEALRAQQTHDGHWLVEARDVPAMGLAAIHTKATREAPGSGGVSDIFRWKGTGLQTPYYELAWNEYGQLTRIFDRTAGRSVLASSELGNVLQVFEDKPKSRHEAWDIDIYYMQKMREVTDFEGASLLENGDLRAVVRFRWRYMKSTIEQDLVVYSSSRRIDFVTEVDWHERQQLLKVAFPVDIRATNATYDIQFGNVKRPTHWNTSWDYARFETVGHQWADLSERGYGVSLLNDCKYGYDIKENVLRLTLIKSALVPDNTADQGLHEFTYALLPHVGDWLQGDTVREAWSLNQPLVCALSDSTIKSFSLIDCSSDHVMIDAVKKSEDEDAIVIRLHEFAGSRGQVKLDCGIPIDAWQECDLLERPIAEPQDGSVLEFEIKPYEIRTFLIHLFCE